jgi:hypothetical protein
MLDEYGLGWEVESKFSSFLNWKKAHYNFGVLIYGWHERHQDVFDSFAHIVDTHVNRAYWSEPAGHICLVRADL